MINTRNDELREFQTRLTTVGKIRLGVFNPEGRGRPQKIDTFRLTSADGDLIRAAAGLYGGTPTEWKPQGGGAAQWQVITDTNALPVYAVNGQKIDPVYEAWAGGRTCVRRCDGVWNQIKNEECVCNGPTPPATRDLCKITTRVLVMLQEIPGLGSWMLETHGENAAYELSLPSQLIAAATLPVPAMLRLRGEQRRTWSAEKNKFETLGFYVPWLDINIITSQQIGLGGDALTLASVAAGAPAAIGSEPVRAAIEASQTPPPVTNSVASPGTSPSPAAAMTTPAPIVGAPSPVTPEERTRILQAIEKADLTALEKIKDAMVTRGIREKPIQDAWVSKHKAWIATLRQEGDDLFNLAVSRGATPAEMQREGSVTHWLAVYDQNHPPESFAQSIAQMNAEWAAYEAAGAPDNEAGPPRPLTNAEAAWTSPGVDGDMFENRNVPNPDGPAAPPASVTPNLDREYRVGDEVTVAGLTFVKISDNPFEPGSDVVDAEISDDRTVKRPDDPWAPLEPGLNAADIVDAVLVEHSVPTLGPLGSVDDEYNAVCSLAFTNGREWSTVQTHDAIKKFCDVGKVSLATAADLRALRMKMIEEPTWAPSV
jgi:hypothetical protein